MSDQLIISGMHRSGTSLVASVLRHAGVDVGRDIAGPGRGNPRGHFEDRDFHRLHEDMLSAAGKSWFSAGDDFAPPESAGFERRARKLIEDRSALPLWGWKDPRTCLFLDLWHPLLPDARYLFLYRHPLDVALSLWRRNTDPELRQDPWLTIRAWEVYNRRLLDFRARHPGRTFLAQVPALTSDFGSLVRRLRDELGLPLQNGSVPPIFAAEELAPFAVPSPGWEKLIPGALALYQRLQESADLPAREAAGTGARRPDRERDMLQTSESLLQTLLERTRSAGPLTPAELRIVELERHVRDLERHAQEMELRVPELERYARELEHRIPELERELGEESRRTAEITAAFRAQRQLLEDIYESRSFIPIRAWWWLRRRLNGQGT